MAQQPWDAGSARSNGSTRSRRDEVWERKRQRWLAKQGVSHAPANGYGQQPPQGGSRNPGDDSLSQLVQQGYPPAQSGGATPFQPYGDRPSSSAASRGGSGNSVRSTGSTGRPPHMPPSQGGFNSQIAGQWSSNVVEDRQRRQDRYDPSNAGPYMPPGGQRVTQPSGGHANVDLSWGPVPAQTPNSGRGGCGAPPRMPGGPTTPTYAQPPSYSDYGQQQMHGQQQMYGQQQHYAQQQMYGQQQYAQQQLPYQPDPCAAGGGAAAAGGRRGPSPSHRNTSPWHQAPEEHVPQRRTPSSRRDDGRPPFGVDAPAGGASARSGSRGRREREDPYNAPAAGGQSVRGRGAGRTPGGASQIVFG